MGTSDHSFYHVFSDTSDGIVGRGGDGHGVVVWVVWVGKHGLEETFCCECQHIKIENCEHYISPPYFSAVKVMFLS